MNLSPTLSDSVNTDNAPALGGRRACTDPEAGTWYSCGIALVGYHGRGPNKWGPPSSISGYDTRLERAYVKLMEGGWVVDKRPAFERDHDAAYRAVFKGPIDEPSLPDWAISKLSMDRDVYIYYPPMDSIGGTDYAGMGVYSEYWENLGARIGRRRGDNIIWNDGAIEPITFWGD